MRFGEFINDCPIDSWISDKFGENKFHVYTLIDSARRHNVCNNKIIVQSISVVYDILYDCITKELMNWKEEQSKLLNYRVKLHSIGTKLVDYM